MKNRLGLTQNLSQSLQITPQLQLALRILQLNKGELLEKIKDELTDNPLLEMTGDIIDSASSDKFTDIWSIGENDLNKEQKEYEALPFNFDNNKTTAKSIYSKEDNNDDLIENLDTVEISLDEYLLEQIKSVKMSVLERKILEYLIGNLDSSGFLVLSYEEICSKINCSCSDLEKAIETLKGLDPAGIGARDATESLLFQLERQDCRNKLEGKILTIYQKETSTERFEVIAKKENVSIQEVHSALNVIRSLNPFPGNRFLKEETRYTTPDIYIYKSGDEYQVMLNDEGIPSISLNPIYTSPGHKYNDKLLAKDNFFKEKYRSALWLMRCINQRRETILKVSKKIVEHQSAFLDYGLNKIKPLTMKDIATELNIHESTVSRVSSNKYALTPQGIFELKFFFKNSLQTDDGLVSSTSLKEKIKNLIAEENTVCPLSDLHISDILNKQNIQIARRTVAKYREELGIPTSSVRKRRNSLNVKFVEKHF